MDGRNRGRDVSKLPIIRRDISRAVEFSDAG